MGPQIILHRISNGWLAEVFGPGPSPMCLGSFYDPTREGAFSLGCNALDKYEPRSES